MNDICFRQNPIDAYTMFTCQIGGENNHSVTPLIYSEVFEKAGLNIIYMSLSILPEHLEDAIKGMRAMRLKAFYITMPHKKTVMQYLDEIDPDAAAIGAVNLVINENGKLKGYNGDVTGFMYPLKDMELKNRKVLFLGSGGAGAACSFGLAQAGADLVILSRNADHAKALADNLTKSTGRAYKSAAMTEENIEAEIKDAYMVVNSTNVGYGDMADLTPVPERLLRKDLIVYDIVNTPATPLIQAAQRTGCLTFDGNDMLAFLSKVFIEALTGEKQSDEIVKISREAGIKALLSLQKN